MKKLMTICLAATMILMIGSVANAHWDSNMPYKMHYPQLPDPYGWDISFSTVLADDWQCSQSGPVKDIHFWVSLKGDVEPPEVGPAIYVGIYSNIPAELSATGYSTPGNLLWSRVFEDGEYEGEDAGTGSQGWLDPLTGEALLDDHDAYYLVNIDDIKPIEGSPLFLQEEGQIYWLAIQAGSLSEDYQFGWKTSISPHFQDDAVFAVPDVGWQELKYPTDDPRSGLSIDLAFVITPEPATICLLSLGTLSLISRKK